MTYRHHTHKLILKNVNELLKNCELHLSENGTQIESYSQDNASVNTKQTILVPGFLNLHTHLAFSQIKPEKQNLFPWLKELIYQSQKIGHMEEGSRIGTKAALSSGTTFLIDNTSDLNASYKAIKESGLKAIIGLELFGSDPMQAEKIFQTKINELDQFKETKNIELALSPHACYDVSLELWQKVFAWSQANNKFLLTHIAESKAEEAWFQNKDSQYAKEAIDFWSWLKTLDAKLENWQHYKNSCEFLIKNDLGSAKLLLTHLCYASLESMRELKNLKAKFISCPRSNEYLGNKVPEHQSWAQEGFDFALGTDSIASNYDLDMRKEANTIKSLSDKDRFALITEKAAKLIGKSDTIGTLDEGKAADFVILELQKEDIDLNDDNGTIDPFKIIMDTEICKVKQVFVDARMVFKDETRN